MNAHISSPQISMDDTHVSSMQYMPQIKGVSPSRFPRQSPSKGNFGFPGGLTLDVDSALGSQSRLSFKERLGNSSTTRNIRNNTIDIPGVQSGGDIFRTAKKSVQMRGAQINSATRKFGTKRASLPQPQNIFSSPNLHVHKIGKFVEDSEAQLAGIDNGNINLPMI